MNADINKSIITNLRELHLPAMRECFDEAAETAQNESLSYQQYLLELSERECEARRSRKTERLLRQSRLPLHKNINTLEITRFSPKVKQQIAALRDGTFPDRCENILAFGSPGTGKTHILCSLGQELIRKGKKVYFTPCSILVQDLLSAKKDLKLIKMIKRLSKYDVLIIDDIGYVQQSRDEMEVLFTLLAERYERGSVMISSNLPFSKWESIFKDPMTTAAVIDRLVHHCVIIELNIKSYRMEKAKNNVC